METTRGGLRPWLFGGLLVIGAGLMLASWFTPWWSAQVSGLVIPGNHLTMHPWGVEVVPNIAAAVDHSVYEMPVFLAPLVWACLAACMAALLASLFVERTIALGRFKVSLSQALIANVGLAYVFAAAVAFAIAQLKSADAGVHFLGTTEVFNPVCGGQTKFTGSLEPGYWLAVAAGPLLILLALLRNVITGRGRT